MRPDPLGSFAWNVRTRRRALGLTQEAAGERILMSTSYWSRIERGLIDVGLRTMTRIAAALETSPAELLGGIADDDEPTTPPPAPYQLTEMTTSSDDEEIVITIRRAPAA